MKLALGTVQFGLNYGINNQSGIPDDEELNSIFLLAKEAGIDVLDTAQGYGNAERRIGKVSQNRFQVITKFKQLKPPFPFQKELTKSLNILKSNSVYGYLAHDADLLIQNPIWWNGLEELKAKGLVKKIGYSLYTVNQLESLLANQMIPDLIQFPFNILDRRFEPYFAELTTLGVEIQIRSVYLQGLLLMKPNEIPTSLKALYPFLTKVREIVIKHNVSIRQVCLKFVIENPWINKVVIGIDNSQQLMDNISICQDEKLHKDIIDELLSLEVKDKNLLNPANWKIINEK